MAEVESARESIFKADVMRTLIFVLISSSGNYFIYR
jgi:hypothetical protein